MKSQIFPHQILNRTAAALAVSAESMAVMETTAMDLMVQAELEVQVVKADQAQMAAPVRIAERLMPGLVVLQPVANR